MADIFFDNWDDLISAVDGVIPDILQDDVAPIAENILKKHIKSDIYDVYTPKPDGWVNGETYKRRHVLEENIISILSGNTLTVTSTATASPAIVKGWSFHNRYVGAFLKLLESGNMGIWKSGFPRPAVSNTEEEFGTSKDIAKSVRNGIKRKIET